MATLSRAIASSEEKLCYNKRSLNETSMNSFVVFWNSSLHGDTTRMGVRAFYVIEKEIFSEVFRNQGRHHAEDRVIKSVRDLLPSFLCTTLSITVFQSHSPCVRCSSRYRQLLEEARRNHVTLKLTIVFAGLYKLLRPSCLRKGCRHDVSPEKHGQQLEGLEQLRDSGVKLRSFDFNDWKRVARHLEEPEMSRQMYRASIRAEEDANVKADLQELGLRTSASLEFTQLVDLLDSLTLGGRCLRQLLTSLMGALGLT